VMAWLMERLFLATTPSARLTACGHARASARCCLTTSSSPHWPGPEGVSVALPRLCIVRQHAVPVAGKGIEAHRLARRPVAARKPACLSMPPRRAREAALRGASLRLEED